MELTKNLQYSMMAKDDDSTIDAVYTTSNGDIIVEHYLIEDSNEFESRLTIKRKDGEPFRSWRDFQDIKNQIVGEELVAIEVYPKESEVTDTANMYHLWVYMPGGGPKISLIPNQST